MNQAAMENEMDIDAPLSGPSSSRQPPAPSAVAAPVLASTGDNSSLPPHLFQSGTGRLTSFPARTGYVYDVQMMLHQHPTGHPEDPQRIIRIFEAIKLNGCIDKMKRLPIRRVRRDEAMLVHTEDHCNKVEAIQHMTAEDREKAEAYYEHLSLYVSPDTTTSAQLSCGGVIEAGLAVARGEVRNAFAIVRPPGHHAEPEEHMGFCFYNNVAVAVKVIQQETRIKRVLILDWDVHHGNGTQRAFYDDPSVLYISIHRYDGGEFYPCGPFGGLHACGEGPGLGTSVNVPWPEPGMNDADYLYAFIKIVLPIAYEFAPELVVICAGFDAADGDDLGECFVSPSGYAHMTHMLSALAGGKMLVALEGGYNLDSISSSALAVTRVLLGESPPELPPQEASEVATETVWQVAMVQSRYWKSISPKACEPQEEVAENIFTIPELLKAHRREYMYRTHNMFTIPFANEVLQQSFENQVICTQDVYTAKTMVLFLHDFGQLRIELQSALHCNVNLEHSYIVDASKSVIDWVRAEKFAIIDMNIFAKPLADRTDTAAKVKNWAKDAVVYVWDNYVDLSDAESVILISHGSGCQSLVDLIHARTSTVRKKVKAIIQVVGLGDVPMAAKRLDNDDANFNLPTWYHQHSLVILPSTHRIFLEARKLLKRHGNIQETAETRVTKILHQSMPDIKAFVQHQLDPTSKTTFAQLATSNGAASLTAT
ncbi:hypothetical protein BOTBODRAFT_25795 [Botryobasidium botryosum FD-172 SS1]|uniref:histone deacetylase n=1 Tax=Botryobasidium botryosum (strain FD-172 SS1) TaxID=930990 RepID=A0A067N0K8_BOTB1|nr:hypothetical protein BOTBODRAFT_25795 [Botryobasidium botryosum FD-172 SS1]